VWIIGIAVIPLAVVGALVGNEVIGKDDGADTAHAAAEADAADTSVLEAAYDACREALTGENQTLTWDRIELTDGGHAIVGDGPGEYGRTDAYIANLACILNEVGTPDYIISQMDSTTSLMGRQEASWGEVNANWSYHPDNGFDVVLYDNS
jgi:hypothetical protein